MSYLRQKYQFFLNLIIQSLLNHFLEVKSILLGKNYIRANNLDLFFIAIIDGRKFYKRNSLHHILYFLY